ncbi:MAG: FAD-dependent thymidylate synthase [Candidatus Liptonbacteria bacterium]|nr:FAD-dependent thymidylate synthase [Candidatus Liptonbacteria bacterium]
MEEKKIYLEKQGEKLVPTEAGMEYLSEAVTDPTGPVYALTGKLSPAASVACMARLSRSSSDMRMILLKEFAGNEESIDKFVEKVTAEYGDDSVLQLGTISLVVEGASNLLTKILEWGRLMAYLEQSTRYIFFDEPGPDGKFRYFVPGHLPEPLKEKYVAGMEGIFTLYSEVARGITAYLRNKNPEPAEKAERQAWLNSTRAQACDAARGMLPVATRSTVGIVGSTQAVQSLILHLFASELPEAQETGKQILKEARKVASAFFKRTDMPDRGIAWSLYARDTEKTMRSFAKDSALVSLPANDSELEREVSLCDYYPKDEMDLIPEFLYAVSGTSLEVLRRVVAGWSEAKKEEVWSKYIGNRLNRRHKPGRALEAAFYEFEILADYGTFRDLQRHRMVSAWEWQRLTPRYGYSVPELVRDSGYEEKFHESLCTSKELCESLIEPGFEEESQYATSLAHRMRYRFVMNAREAFHMIELRTQPAGHPGYRKICQNMHRLIEGVHPKMAGAMKFINQEGDPELTRLEAERATQAKLALLGE